MKAGLQAAGPARSPSASMPVTASSRSTAGPRHRASVRALDLALAQFEDAGVAAVIYTDIDRDGAHERRQLSMPRSTLAQHRHRSPVIASGGLSFARRHRAHEHAAGAQEFGIVGAIVGPRALRWPRDGARRDSRAEGRLATWRRMCACDSRLEPRQQIVGGYHRRTLRDTVLEARRHCRRRARRDWGRGRPATNNDRGSSDTRQASSHDQDR